MGKLVFVVFVFLFLIASVSASSYNIEFSQNGADLQVNESVNGNLTQYTDSGSLDFNGNEIYFIKKIIFPEDFDSAEIKLNLEKGVVVKEVFPANYGVESDGQTISVIWKLENVSNGQVFASFVSLEDTRARNSFFIIFGAALVIAIAFGIIIYFKRKEKNYDYLLDSEKKIIDELKKAPKKELWQKQLQNSSEFSKAKVSRVVRNLEARGLIKKIPYGNTNKIRLV